MLSAGNILKDFIWISHWVANTLIKLQTNGSVNKLQKQFWEAVRE